MSSRRKRDDTRGGSHYETLRLRNHPPRDPLRDPAALLTEEGNFPASIQSLGSPELFLSVSVYLIERHGKFRFTS